MKTAQYLAAAALIGALAVPGAAMAQQTAFAVTDLNMRIGPGPDFEVVTVIPAQGSVTVLGCTETMRWCEVTFDGHTGWAFADYLTIEVAGTPMVVPEATAQVEVPVATFDGPTTGAAGGAVSGAQLGGPAGARAGGAPRGARGAGPRRPARGPAGGGGWAGGAPGLRS
jgi:uncharacterized protein YraI